MGGVMGGGDVANVGDGWFNSSMSAFLACHQYYCVGLNLAWGLNLQALACGIFSSSSPGVFSRYYDFWDCCGSGVSSGGDGGGGL